MNLINYFPKQGGRNPYPQQIEVIDKIGDAIKRKKKFIMVSAPTGFGKSMIPATLANYSNEPDPEFIRQVESYSIYNKLPSGGYPEVNWTPFGCTTLTITKNLQDQYANDFEDIEVLKGQGNYQCEYDPDYDVESGPCKSSKALLRECWSCNRCTYFTQRNESLVNKFSTLNYKVFFSLPEHVKYRQFLVLDEASEVDEELVSNFTFQIKKKSLQKLKINIRELVSEDDRIARNWLVELGEKLSEMIEVLIEKMKDKSNMGDFIRSKTIYKIITNMSSKIKLVLDNWILQGGGIEQMTEFIVEITDDEYIFIPYKVDRLSRHIFDYADHIILMSASFVGWRKTCQDLGISLDDVEYIESPECFKSSKSPIYVSTKYPLTRRYIDRNLPKVIDIVEQICKKHENEKGIIHTHSFSITQELKRRMLDPRFLYREDGVSNIDILNTHIESEHPTVIVSPSMTHGVDLKGNLGKFQIIVKIPYLPVGSKRIGKLFKNDFAWYQNKMLSTLIQASGRCTRSYDDESVTYIVDGSIEGVIKRCWDNFPKYFRDRFV